MLGCWRPAWLCRGPLGVPAITFWHAAGLGALLSVLLGSRDAPALDTANPGETLVLGFLYAVLVPLFGLAAGWIAHVNM